MPHGGRIGNGRLSMDTGQGDQGGDEKGLEEHFRKERDWYIENPNGSLGR